MMFNPEIIKASEETEIDQEWCLSVPGEKGKVERYSSIKLSYQNEKWDEKTLVLNHLTARIVQHEIDHLDGILFTDKAL
jgi:peptide deformylase